MPRISMQLIVGALFSSIAATSGAQSLGLCRFDTRSLSFAGDARQQAQCLLRPVLPYAHTGDERPLPANLARLIGTQVNISAVSLAKVLQASPRSSVRGLTAQLNLPVSRAHGGSARAPYARYFVIHDTSSPNFGDAKAFPVDIDRSDRVNTFRWYPTGAKAKAHVFINRRGEFKVFQDYRVPWRATKLELKRVGLPAKGLFLHHELIQPRRDDDRGIDAFAPDPGFTQSQYDDLALFYVIASTRAGRWLIPAFHGTIDAKIAGGHDDPQNFALTSFDESIGTLLRRVEAQR